VGSEVAQGTVLGRVRVPIGARNGHIGFAIRPAGDPETIAPGPILENWTQLDAALHPKGVKGEPKLFGATNGVRRFGRSKPRNSTDGHTAAAHSAGAASTAPSPFALGELTATQWNRLIARIALLPAPKVAEKPSSAAVPDPQAGAGEP
jgi:hypothetical protein